MSRGSRVLPQVTPSTKEIPVSESVYLSGSIYADMRRSSEI
jgi:hypothetical protein